jgi:hypothetical protein
MMYGSEADPLPPVTPLLEVNWPLPLIIMGSWGWRPDEIASAMIARGLAYDVVVPQLNVKLFCL